MTPNMDSRMRTFVSFIAFLLLLPLSIFELYAALAPHHFFRAPGVVWWFTLPVALFGLAGMYALWWYCHTGKRTLGVLLLSMSLATFISFSVAMLVNSHPLRALGILAYYVGGLGVFAFAWLTLAFFTALVLLWAAREYIFAGDG